MLSVIGALVTLGVRTGLRISELLALKVGQVWDGKKHSWHDSTSPARTPRANMPELPSCFTLMRRSAVTRWIKAGGLAVNPHEYHGVKTPSKLSEFNKSSKAPGWSRTS
jgi:integrase